MRVTGTVKFFNTAKGFGFITPENGGKDVFVHATALEAAGIRSLNEGDRVSFVDEPYWVVRIRSWKRVRPVVLRRSGVTVSGIVTTRHPLPTTLWPSGLVIVTFFDPFEFTVMLSVTDVGLLNVTLLTTVPPLTAAVRRV